MWCVMEYSICSEGGKMVAELYIYIHMYVNMGVPGASVVVCLPNRRCGFDPWVRKIPWRRKWQPTPVFWPGKFHGQRSLVGYSPWGHNESDTQQQHSVSDTGLMLEIKSYLSCSSRSLQFRYVHCYFLKLIFSYTSKT